MIINMNGAKAPETPSPVLQEKTVTPETLPVVIGADEGYDGLSQVTVNPDSQLKAENIRSGKTIFGVTGTFVGEPTAGVDLNEFTGKTLIADMGTPFLVSDFLNLVSEPPTVDNPFVGTTRNYYTADTTQWVIIGYGSGGISVNETDKLLTNSTYSPNRNYYMTTGTIGGDVTFKMPRTTRTIIGTNYSHIKGTVYLCPVMGISSIEPTVDYSNSALTSCFLEVPEISTVELDHDFTMIGEYPSITVTLPEKNYTIYNYTNSAVHYSYLGYVIMPHQVVIS